MTHALVIQMLEVLESTTYNGPKMGKAITAAREYLATEPSGERAGLVAGLRDLAPILLNGRILTAAADMLEADAQQRSKPHGHCMHIKCREIWVAYLGSIQKLSKYEPGATMHLNKEP